MGSDRPSLQCAKEDCRFDFLTLDWTLELTENQLDKQGVVMWCPACGQKTTSSLNEYEFFQFVTKKKRKLYRWRSSAVPYTGGDKAYKIELGQLKLIFPEELVGNLKFSVDSMCYSAVPVFSKRTGKDYYFPDFPVLREYLPLVDTIKGCRHELIDGRLCKFQFYLKNISQEPFEVSLPLVPVDASRDAVGDNAIIGGIHLVLWPKIQYKEWNQYFVRFGGTPEALKSLEDERRHLEVYSTPAADLDTELDWAPISHKDTDGLTRLAYLQSRPRWLAIEFEDRSTPNGEVQGGLWSVAPVVGELPSHNETEVGVDFGTSNTCFSVKGHSSDEAELMAIESCDDPIIDGAVLPSKLDAPDLWPPRDGFGKGRTLLPSELLTRASLDEIRQNPGMVGTWQPILDYTIPTSGVEVKFEDRNYTIAEFKLASMVDSSLTKYCSELQRRYLELLLIYAMARLASVGELRETVRFTFSYPLAFSADQKEAFIEVLNSVAASISNPKSGLTVKCELSVDEARAAARRGGHTIEAVDNAALFVDIGGGSADIALLKIENGRPKNYVYVCSFEYAGGALATALVEGSGDCLRAGTDLAVFRRKVRDAGSIRELAATEDLFLRSRHSTLVTKSSYFYGYLLQFLARLLAAHLLTGKWQESTPEETKEVITAEGFRVLFYGFGNGWGYGDLIDKAGKYRNVFGELLEEATNSIIQSAKSEGFKVAGQDVPKDSPEVAIKTVEIKQPKSAVACGLLSASVSGYVEETEWPFRTIVGWTTTANLNQKIDWYQAIEGGALAPKGYQKIAENSKLDCKEGEWPPFPHELPGPHFWDNNLDKTRGYLETACSPKGAQAWLQDSPFRILLERTFKDALKKAI